MKDLTYADPSHKILQRLIKRLNRYKDELLTFLYHPGIASNNNQAERQIRPNVLMSLLQTAKLNHLNPLQGLQRLIIAFDDQPNLLPKLIPP